MGKHDLSKVFAAFICVLFFASIYKNVEDEKR